MSTLNRKEEAFREIEMAVAETEPSSLDDPRAESIGFAVERVYRDDNFAYIVVRIKEDKNRTWHVRIPLLEPSGEISHYGQIGHLLGAYIQTKSHQRQDYIIDRTEGHNIVDASDMF